MVAFHLLADPVWPVWFRLGLCWETFCGDEAKIG